MTESFATYDIKLINLQVHRFSYHRKIDKILKIEDLLNTQQNHINSRNLALRTKLAAKLSYDSELRS